MRRERRDHNRIDVLRQDWSAGGQIVSRTADGRTDDKTVARDSCHLHTINRQFQVDQLERWPAWIATSFSTRCCLDDPSAREKTWHSSMTWRDTLNLPQGSVRCPLHSACIKLGEESQSAKVDTDNGNLPFTD